ncbi:retinol dehydrogenase 12-like isoform X1 [Octopus sinensis]|uniref:Retinol dehydrogenase 12-like isoform X1 n=1 Tax=Octopus sinensis TaxID=2607531 RepID=A0A7E6FK84_9MOLL|nr:retinol dehydrogenase 12-like isoform X1 [Octopus sinensis]
MPFLVYIVLPVAVICLTLYVVRVRRILRFHGGPLVYYSDVTLHGKTVLVTGGNTGIGKETALDLASRGARVIIACRDLVKAENAAKEIKKMTGNESVATVHLDLADLESVKKMSQQILKNETRLDILINNAGIGVKVKECTKQNFDLYFGVNYLGHFLLTYLLLDLLKKSAPSRIINVSSHAHIFVKRLPSLERGDLSGKVKYPQLSGYATSKLANILHAQILAKKLKGTGVTANSLHPGMVKTEILKNNPINSKELLRIEIYRLLFKYMGRSAKDGAKVVIHMAVDKSLENVSGQYFENLSISSGNLSRLAKDLNFAKNLWDISLELCNAEL